MICWQPALAEAFVPERILGVLADRHEAAFVLIGALDTPAGSTGYGSLVAGAALIQRGETPVQLADLVEVVDSTANRPRP